MKQLPLRPPYSPTEKNLIGIARNSRLGEGSGPLNPPGQLRPCNRYSRTSSVSSMLSQLNWQPLVERRRHARLVMFYKIHYRLVSICIPLTWKFHLQPTCTENIFPITSHHLVVIIIYSHSFHELFGTGIRYHRKSFIWALSKLSDVPFLPSKDCWSAPCTCCVESHCF